ncbi:septal ring lytic transglycosylase RlpA family protein [Azonexus sp.]|uniref:septal ring lytic transglycosylase RlpA family protein n=1 Tax=Azonexus sp. TaxID=1872668 RepID=UPI0039E24DEB
MNKSWFFVACSAIFLASCGSTSPPATPSAPAATASASAGGKISSKRPGGGGYYKDDGPADDIPANLDQIPDAVPQWEPLHKPALRPYEVFGTRYVPHTSVRAYKTRGIASWYGKKFHGQKTSIGVPYDMFAMTAAHPTLALPSYVRVTRLDTGKSVVVRVIDRGPFHADRVIDLSYTAAHKLGLIQNGSGQVEVEAIIPSAGETVAYAQLAPPPVAQATAPAPQVENRLPPGIYLQLGAFANADNADNLKRHLERELDWLGERMHIVRNPPLHRVQLGPYAERAAAEAVAARIQQAVGYKPSILTR